MRIVQVCPYDMARPGGVQRHIRDLAGWLRGRGHAVRILSPAPHGRTGTNPEAEEIGRARRLAMNGTGFEFGWIDRHEVAAIAKDLHDWGAEIAHFHTPCTPVLSLRLWRGLTLPRVATFHSTPPDADRFGLKTRAARLLSGWFLRRAEASVFPADHVRALFADLPARRPPVVLPPAIDLAPWQVAGSGPGVSNASTGEGPHLVYLGRLEPRKGLWTLLAAWPQIASTFPRARLTIAGSGAGAGRLAAVSRSDPRVRHLPAPDDAGARALIASADFLIAPAAYGESFGIILIEALSAGTLPIAAANPGYASVLAGPGAALLFRPGDPQDLVDRLAALASAPAQCSDLRAWGTGHAARFGIAAQGPAYERLYRSVLAGVD